MRSRSRNPGHVDLLEPGQPICFLILSYSSLRSQLGIKPRFETMAKGVPILVDQDQDGVRNLAGEGLIAIQVLDPVEDFCIRYPDPGVDVGLAKVVGGLIVEVLRGEGRSVDSRIVGTALLDTMLLDELHWWPPSSYSLLSCYSLEYPKKRSPARVSCSNFSNYLWLSPLNFVREICRVIRIWAWMT